MELAHEQKKTAEKIASKMQFVGLAQWHSKLILYLPYHMIFHMGPSSCAGCFTAEPAPYL